MTIEIHQPELEELIRQRMASGNFRNVEDALLAALRSPEDDVAQSMRDESLHEIFAKVRGLADDLDIHRDQTSARPVDLS